MNDYEENHSDPEHYNAWILASAMWDIIKDSSILVNDTGGSSGDFVPDTFSWDKIFWLPYLNEQPSNFSDYADAVVYWAGFWGQSFVDHATSVFQQHGINVSPAAPPAIWTVEGVQKPQEIVPPARSLLLPQETKLLANFPNPFNPETWIPYQLASEADAVIHVYDISGQLIRTLDLGHQQAGLYIERKKAAYWDGKNDAGERISSGVYFYTLFVDDKMVQTSKLSIQK